MSPSLPSAPRPPAPAAPAAPPAPEQSLAERCLRLEATLRQAEARHEALVEGSPGPVLVHRDGLICYANLACQRLWAGTLVGTDLRDSLQAEDRALVEPPAGGGVTEQPAPIVELRLHLQAGRELVVESQGRSIEFRGHPATLLVLHDVTERRRADEARQLLQLQVAQSQKVDAVARMAGGIGHDFNNLVSVIWAGAAAAQSLLDEKHPAQAELSMTVKAIGRSVDFVRQLLDFSRKSTAAPRLVDLSSSLAATATMLRRLLGETVDLASVHTEPIWPVLVDHGRLDQALAHLAVNGREAAPGHGRLELNLANVTLPAGIGPVSLVPGQYVRLTLSDDGCRLDETTRARIFEPLFTSKTPGAGAGFGLAGVRDTLEEMGGAVTVESRAGAGARFLLFLPRHTDAVPAPLPSPARVASDATARSRGKTVLVVEDEAAALTVVGDLLRRAGYDVLTAPSPTAALAVFKAQGGRVDLLLTDVIMPTLDGDQLARQLMALAPGLRVLYMSGYPADILADRLQATPSAGFLPKPFTPTMLFSQVRRLLDAPLST